MMFLSAPWSVMGVFVVLLLLLLIRELFIIIQVPPLHPERKMAMFNCFILFIFLISCLYGMRMLMAHEAQFATILERYPNSRYAPEREFFAQTGDWVYVTEDDADSVVSYYQADSAKNRFQITLDETGEDKLFLFEQGGKKIFLTIKKENTVTVLYFSQTGEVKSVPSSPR